MLQGDTPLHIAAQIDHLLVKMLLVKGADRVTVNNSVSLSLYPNAKYIEMGAGLRTECMYRARQHMSLQLMRM